MKSKPTSTNWLADLKALNPCDDGYAFAGTFKTWQDCWDNIERGDWSLWVLGKLSGAPESDSRKRRCAVKTYKLSDADAMRHVPEFPERTAFRAGIHEFGTNYQVWPSRASMLKTIEMQGRRAPNTSRDWIDCQTHLERRAKLRNQSTT